MTQELDTFTWLHLSDLHAGLTPQGWLWPGVKTALFEDLERLYKKLGAWDVVIFSGDLTQQASTAEFEKLQNILAEIWSKFNGWGWNPPLVVVPGNHDLVRPHNTDAASLLMRRWWDEPAVQDAFWEPKSQYRDTIEAAFANYASWLRALPANGVLTCASEHGILPGDRSHVLEIRGKRIGILSLNSSWLQLGDGDYSGKLHVDVRQIMALTSDDPDNWCRQNDINLLVSHHPTSWLHPASKKEWDSEINPPGRFDAHLFGHMHEPDSLMLAQSGSEPRTALQAASLFGLEKLPNGVSERIHGFSVGRICLKGGKRKRSIWPRRLVRQTSGKRRLVPDYVFDLNDDDAFEEEYDLGGAPRLTPPGRDVVRASAVQIAPVTIDGRAALDKVRYHLPPSKAHLNVRTFEQQACVKAIEDGRALWSHADWGMGADGFLWAVQRRLAHGTYSTFRIDLQTFETRTRFFDSIKNEFGVSFEQLCELISQEEEAYLILDDIPVQRNSSAHCSVEQDVEDIVKAVLEYCPKAIIVLRSRRGPLAQSLPAVGLVALDEADLATYVAESDFGGADLKRPDVINKLFRHTEGAPSRVDIALEELKVVALSGLVSANPDFAGANGQAAHVPPALIHAVGSIAKATDPGLRRAYELLKTLAIFPQGEQLERVKRFNNAQPFFPAHARELLNRSLINSHALADVGVAPTGDMSKILVVPKSVRDYLKTILKSSELKSLDRRAFELYFGERWKSGTITSPSGHKFDAPLQSIYKISNANALVLRLIRGAIDEDGLEGIETALPVAISYIALLFSGNHFRNVAAISEDLLDMIPGDKYPSETTLISYYRARSLRMIGEVREAADILNTLDLSLLPKSSRQGALLNLAMAHQSLGEDELAHKRAEETKGLGRTEDAALQASAIIIELNRNDPLRWSKLLDLEVRCRRRKSITLANNIALRRAAGQGLSSSERDSIFRNVFISSVKEKDFYNETRAIVEVSRRRLCQGECLTELEKTRLIGSYHFLFNERLTNLFETCHDSLWLEFEARGDTENLLSLFRHSSLIWRLRGRTERETEYLKKLAARVGKTPNMAAGGLTREVAYYLARAGAALLETSKKLTELGQRADNSDDESE